MYDQDQRAPKTGRRPPTFLTTKEWPAAGKWLEESIGITATELQKRLLERDFTTSSNRLRQYFAGERLPEPPTLRAICEAGDLSYVEAVDRFGYYREIIKIFDDLVWLGARWLEEDDARGGTVGPLGADVSHLRSLRDTGVIFWKGEPITWGAQLPWRDKPGLDPRGIPDFQDRYIDVEWRQLEHRAVVVKFPPIEIVPGGTFSMKAPYRLEDVDPSLSRESVDVPERSPHATLPKPIAVALLLAVLAFPLRGDGYKEGAPKYRFDLGNAANALVKEAKRLRENIRVAGRPRGLHPLLQRACDELDDRRIPFNYRRPVAAEYVVIWANATCKPFTEYARLAAFEFWGEAGGRSWSTDVVQLYKPPGTPMDVRIPRPSPFAMQPQLQPADLVDIDELTRHE